jgi:hypothetical protein
MSIWQKGPNGWWPICPFCGAKLTSENDCNCFQIDAAAKKGVEK